MAKTELEPTASALNSGASHLLRSLRAVDRLAGLTPQRLSALSVLVFTGPCSLGSLASAEGVAGPTMTRIVDGLIDAGLAERQVHPTDGRAVLIAATGAGDALMRTAQQRRVDALTEAVAVLPAAAQRQIVSAAGLLDQVAALVKTSAGEPHEPRQAAEHVPSPRVGGSAAVARRRNSERQARLDAARRRWAEAADQMSAAAQRGQRHL